MSQPTQIVIIGAGYAGMIAAQRLAHFTKPEEAHITLVNATDHFVERLRLHQIGTGQPIRQHRITSMINQKRVTFVQAEVTMLDAANRQVCLRVAGETRSLAYDILVYAPGSRVGAETVPGVSANAYLPNGESIQRLAERLPKIAQENGNVVIVGAGLTGIEMATELAETYPDLRIEVITQGTLGADLSVKGQQALRWQFQSLKIAVRENTRVTQVEVGHIILADGEIVPCAAVIWTAGFSVPLLAKDAGLAVNDFGQLCVDETLRSLSNDAIYGVGDAAEVILGSGRPQRMGCVTALPMGAHAAANIAATLHGKPPTPFRFGYVIRCISLGRRAGLVQQVDATDQPREKVYTGRTAAVIKELICWYTLFSVRAERYISPLYRWPQPVQPSAALETRAARG